jgi:hypothetical protein
MREVAQIEAIKYSLRQTKDGTVVSFVIQPEDIDPALNNLPIGRRIMFGWYEIGDDEKPVGRAANGSAAEGNDSAADAMDETAHRSGSGSSPERPPKQKRKFSELSLPEQCALRIYEDPRFERFIHDERDIAVETKEDLNVYVKQVLGVDSKRELSRNHDAANKWRQLFETPFQRWLTDQEYKDSVR